MCISLIRAIRTLCSEEYYIIGSRNIITDIVNIRERFYLLVFQGVSNEDQEIQKVTMLCVSAIYFSCWAFGILTAVVYTGSDSVFRVTRKKRFYWALQDKIWAHEGGVWPQGTLSSGKACCIPAGHAGLEARTEFYRRHVEIWHEVNSPK